MSTAVQTPTQSQNAQPMDVIGALGQGLGQLIPVVSVHWAEIKEERRFQTVIGTGMRTFYHWNPVLTAKDKPSVWIVTDGVEKTYLGDKKWGRTFDASTAPKIAADMVRCGSGGDVGGAETILPAVWISTASDCPKTAIGELILPDDWEKRYPQLAAEVNEYRRREWAWCQQQVDSADALHSKNLADQIYDRHRKSATWIGANPLEHLWMNPASMGAGAKKECPFCATSIPVNAIACPNAACGQVLDYAAFEAKKAELMAMGQKGKQQPVSAGVKG